MEVVRMEKIADKTGGKSTKEKEYIYRLDVRVTTHEGRGRTSEGGGAKDRTGWRLE